MDFAKIYTEEERIKKIKKEEKKLRKILTLFDEKTRTLIEKLVEEAAFMIVTMQEAKRLINRDGIIEPYQNGQNQMGMKKSSAVEIYDKTANTYMKLVKQIIDALPIDEENVPVDNEAVTTMMEFIRNGPK